MKNLKVEVITCTKDAEEDINEFIKDKDIYKIAVTEGMFDTIYIFYK